MNISQTQSAKFFRNFTIAFLPIVFFSPSTFAQEANSRQEAEQQAKEAYKSFVLGDQNKAKKLLKEIAKAEQSPIVLSLDSYFRSLESMDSTRKSNDGPDEQSSTKIAEAIQKSVDEVTKVTNDFPKSADAFEILGELNNNLGSFKEIQASIVLNKENAEDEAKSLFEESKKFRKQAVKAYEKSVELDPKRSISNIRLVANKMAGGTRLENPEIWDHLLCAIEGNPESDRGIPMLGIVMWQSSILENPRMYNRISRALKNLKGKGREQLKKTRSDMAGQLYETQHAAENIAASGFASAEVDQTISRLSTLLGLVDAILKEE